MRRQLRDFETGRTPDAILAEIESKHGSNASAGSWIVRGRPKNPVGFKWGEDVIRLKGCPDCKGRGWYLIQPFMTGGTNGAGGIGNMCQCETCKHSMAYYEQHGELPPEIAAEINSQNTD